MNRNGVADLVIEADIQRAMRTVENDVKAGKVWFLDLPARGEVPEDIMSAFHRTAIYLVAVNRRGVASVLN